MRGIALTRASDTAACHGRWARQQGGGEAARQCGDGLPRRQGFPARPGGTVPRRLGRGRSGRPAPALGPGTTAARHEARRASSPRGRDAPLGSLNPPRSAGSPSRTLEAEGGKARAGAPEELHAVRGPQPCPSAPWPGAGGKPCERARFVGGPARRAAAEPRCLFSGEAAVTGPARRWPRGRDRPQNLRRSAARQGAGTQKAPTRMRRGFLKDDGALNDER